jgi:hypothetical protein
LELAILLPITVKLLVAAFNPLKAVENPILYLLI